ncbi:MAG: hypothetical protein ABL921_21870 [Pirellula sp.]
MARDEDDDDSLPPLGENTDKFLDQAKKGQPRNFLLVCKGTKVKYLAVRKKPIKKNELNDAKKSGYKGDGYFGVITGKGMELVFNLSTADGYTSEPVKDKILKDFLEEKADFKCKPSIVIVATLPEIPFDDEDLANPMVARFLALGEQITQALDMNPNAESELKQTTSEIRGLLQEADFNSAEPRIVALEARLQALLQGAPANTTQPAPTQPVPTQSQTQPQTQTPPPAPPPPPNPSSTINPPAPPAPTTNAPVVDNDALKLKLQEALNKLVPQLKQAVVTYPDKKVELLTPVAQIKKQLDSGDLQEAKKGILSVGQLLKSVMAQSGSESQPQAENALRAEFESKLAALQPSYAQALKDMLGDTSKFRTVMTYALEQAEAGVYANAIKAIDRLSSAVEQAVGAGANRPQSNSENDLGATYQTKLSALQPRYDQALKEMLGDTTKFRAAMAMALELAAAGDKAGYEKAIQVIDRLSQAVDQAIAAGAKETNVIPENIVSDRKKFLQSRWQDAIRASYAEIEKLAGPLETNDPDPKEMISAITRHLDDFVDELNNAIVNAQLASSEDTSPIQQALKAIKSYRSKITSDPLLVHLGQAKSDLGADVKVGDTLLSALNDIETRLAG